MWTVYNVLTGADRSRGLSWVLGAGIGLSALSVFALWLTNGAEVLIWEFTWSPSLGIALSFRLDGLSVLFLLLIGFVGAVVLPYSGAYLHGNRHLIRFFVLMLMFSAAMAGLVTANNVIALFVFWELTSLTSFFLIGFHNERAAARAAAVEAFLVTATGGLALLASFVLLSRVTGTFEISQLLDSANGIRSSGLYVPIVLLLLLGAFTKSAQMPFHFWLPDAMEAPTPVSAYLHSATMVNAGIYLLARFSPILGGTDLWFTIVCVVGCATAVTGAVIAMGETDMKRLLAYSTVSALGLMTLMIGMGTPAAALACVLYLTAHALYKGALFMVAGILDHQTGLRDLDRLSGLRRAMPLTMLIAVAAGISMAGLPGTLGFVAKEALYESTLHGSRWAAFLLLSAFVTSVFVFALAWIGAFRPFWGRHLLTPKRPRDPDLPMWLGPGILSAAGIIFSLWPGGLHGYVLTHAAAAIVPSTATPMPHGTAVTMGLSALTVAGGVLVYGLRHTIRHAVSAVAFSAQRGYGLAIESMNCVARSQTSFLQSGYLRRYLLTVLATTVLLTGFALVSGSADHWLWPGGDAYFYELVLAATIVLAALAAVRSDSRFGSITALGVTGYALALLYTSFGAPDLAITQFLVETLIIILLVFVFRGLPRFARFTGTTNRIRDGMFAAAIGALMMVLVFGAVGSQSNESVSAYFSQNSLIHAYGRNVVNVILVDFRGLDTLGEITVLAVAGLGVYALLKLRPQQRRP